MSNDAADRLEKLLDVAIAALRSDDEDSTLMALDEALKTAESLPRKDAVPCVICLPDQSRG